jgi:hypothetical protein
MRIFMIVLITRCYSSDENKENELDRAIGAFGWRGEVHTGFWWEGLKEKDKLEDLGIDGQIILQ